MTESHRCWEAVRHPTADNDCGEEALQSARMPWTYARELPARSVSEEGHAPVLSPPPPPSCPVQTQRECGQYQLSTLALQGMLPMTVSWSPDEGSPP